MTTQRQAQELELEIIGGEQPIGKARRGLEQIAASARSKEDLEQMLRSSGRLFSNSIVFEAAGGLLMVAVQEREMSGNGNGRTFTTVTKVRVNKRR